jgi:outer membrane protein assembly factor BamB
LIIKLTLVSAGKLQRSLFETMTLIFWQISSKISCFDLATGIRIWQYRLSQNQMTALDVVLEDNKIVVNGTDATIYCMNAATGAVL